MKTAVAFLLVALSCCCDVPAASKSPAPVHYEIPVDCLQKLVNNDIPSTLLRLQKLLCMYVQGKDADNEELYRRFLVELHTLLKDAGCTVDQILDQKDFLEQVGDKVGEVAHKAVFEILKVADDLELTGKLMDVACKLAGELLVSLSDALGKLNLNLKVDVVKNVVQQLPLLG